MKIMKKRMMSKSVLTATIMSVVALAVGIGVFAAQTITVKGSDTLLLLGQRWSEAFMAKNPNVTIQVTGGGSGVGIAALINGSTDICESSRPIKPSETDKLKERFNSPGVEI